MPRTDIPARTRRKAKELRRDPTEAEKRMWRGLREMADQRHWRRQASIGTYIVDFACLNEKLVVEVDGGQHNDSAHDRRRDEWLRSQGFRILRFWNNDVLQNLPGCLQVIDSTLRGEAMTETRIDRRFAALKKEGRPGLVTFVTAGDPDLKISLDILKSLPKAGADIIELGMPFSDPMADGPAIQAAGQRALKSGQTMVRTLDMVREFRKADSETPVVLMGYYNPIFIYGNERFLADAKAAGVDGLIIVDLPPEADDELCLPAMKHGINFIRLAAPTTDDKRLPRVLQNTSGFLYYVSITGITGTAAPDATKVGQAVQRIRRSTQLPIAVGFGVKTGSQAAAIGKNADAVVVGSALVEAVRMSLDAAGKATGNTVASVTALVQDLASGVRQARA